MNENLALAYAVLEMTSVALARRQFRAFVDYTKQDYIFARHNEALIGKLQAVINRDIRFFYTAMPPRHGKSELCSILYPAFLIGLNPRRQVVLICHSADLAQSFSRQVRQIIRDDLRYRRVFPEVVLDPERQRIDDWKTIQGGGFKALGVGGGITGHGADDLILDDPHKEGDGDSPKILEDTYQWYATAARTRLSPNASIVFPMTRWSPHDLRGRLAELEETEENADRWDSLILPAIAERNDMLGRAPGEALWPERFDIPALLSLKALSARRFESLFQQKPKAEGDIVFEKKYFMVLDPSECVHILEQNDGVWMFDLAVTEKSRSDYTVMSRWVKVGDRFYIHLIKRFRADFPTVKHRIRAMMKVFVEDLFVFPEHMLEILAVQDLKSSRKIRDVSSRIKSVKQTGDKLSRALYFADLLKGGRVFFIDDGFDLKTYIDEHCKFPQDLHDDCVDNSSVGTHHFGIPGEFEAFIKKASGEKLESVRDIWS